jgi:hypothetical protein
LNFAELIPGKIPHRQIAMRDFSFLRQSLIGGRTLLTRRYTSGDVAVWQHPIRKPPAVWKAGTLNLQVAELREVNDFPE